MFLHGGWVCLVTQTMVTAKSGLSSQFCPLAIEEQGEIESMLGHISPHWYDETDAMHEQLHNAYFWS